MGIIIDKKFSYKFSNKVHLFATYTGNRVLWLDEKKDSLHRGIIENNKLTVEDHVTVENFGKLFPGAKPFDARDTTFYWQNGDMVCSGRFTKGRSTINHLGILKPKSKSFAVWGKVVYWTEPGMGNKRNFRRGTLENGAMKTDPEFFYDGFKKNDELFARWRRLLYWQHKKKLRVGRIQEGGLTPVDNLSSDGFNPAKDRLFDYARGYIYWQDGDHWVRRAELTAS